MSAANDLFWTTQTSFHDVAAVLTHHLEYLGFLAVIRHVAPHPLDQALPINKLDVLVLYKLSSGFPELAGGDEKTPCGRSIYYCRVEYLKVPPAYVCIFGIPLALNQLDFAALSRDSVSSPELVL